MSPNTPGWLSYYTLTHSVTVRFGAKAYDMQGELNQTKLCMNECGYMGFQKGVYYVWGAYWK